MKPFDINDSDTWEERERKLINHWMGKKIEHCKPSPDTKKQFKLIQKQMDNHVTKELFASEIKGLKEFIGEKFDRNKSDHKTLFDNQTKTNGSVKDLKAWKLALIFGWSVVSVMFPVLFYYFMANHNKDVELKIMTAINNNNNKFFELE